MLSIWLSSGLPADRSAIAQALGPTVALSEGAFPPAGTAVAVTTVFERRVLEQLAAVPGAGALLLLKPPGTATPQDLPFPAGPSTVVAAADVDEVVEAIRSALRATPAPWSAVVAEPFGGTRAPGGWEQDQPPIGELSGGTAPGPRSSRRNWLASAGIVAAAALAAILVLATQGGASDTNARGFHGRGFAGGYGFPGAGQPGTQQPPGTGQLPGTLQRPGTVEPPGTSGTTETNRASEREAFLTCLQDNGVDVSALRSRGRVRIDPSDPSTASALQACSSLLPRGDGGPPGVAGGPGSTDRAGQPTRPAAAKGRTT